MRDLNYLNDKRIDLFGDGNLGDKHNGFFKLNIDGEEVHVIASNGLGWEHVSVSMKDKTPSWEMMCIIKEMFFDDYEVVMQLHPKKADYINLHEHCLHLWRPRGSKIPTPPKFMV